MKLQLTLLNAKNEAPLSDADNPRPQEGLFSGVAGRHFDPTVVLTDKSSHTFKCKVLLLSSDINGALVKIKVSRPNADAADPLYVVTRAFRSRARSNVHEQGNKRPRSLPNNADIGLNDFSIFSDEDVMLAAQPAELLAAELSPGGSFTTEDTAAWSFTTEDTVLPDLDDFLL